MSRCQVRLSVFFEGDVGIGEESVSAKNLFGLWIPDNELVIRTFAGVEFVDVAVESRAASGSAESDFP